MLKRILFINLCLLLAAGPSLAQESPFKGLFDTAVGYFTPVTGSVKSVEEGIILSDIDSSSGVITGMRLSIFRQGKTFLHPITKEPLGMTESEVGRAELLEATAEGSRLRIIAGEAREGDILRRSSAPVQVLFYQSSNMDWDVSEEYYFQLKNIKMFDILDAVPGSATDEEIAAEAGRRGAEVAIALTADHPPGKMVITQRLIWASDAVELSSEQLTIEEENLKSYKVGEELFAPKKNVPLLTFNIPYSTDLVAVGDIDGDGEKELVLSTGHDVMFYSIGLSLNTALEGVEIDGPVTEEHIWLETHDLDGDGKDEVVLSSLNTFSAISYVYGFSKGSFSELLRKEDLFLRVMDGKLHGQEYSRTRGYRGGVFQVSLDGTEQRDSLLTKPERMDLYDFNLFPTPDDPNSVIAYDERGHVFLYGGGGEPMWRSSEVYAKPTRKYESEKMTEMSPSRKWTLKPRIIIRGDTALAIVRKPVAKIAGTGVWHKDSKLIKLYLKGGSVGESVILGNIPGKILDYNVSDDKVFVLLGSKLSIAPENIIKGKSLFATKLYIYSIRGS